MAMAIPITGVPFPRSEYERPQQKVLETAARVDVKALLAAADSHLWCLTGCQGYSGDSAPFQSTLGLRLARTYVVKVVAAGRKVIERSERACPSGRIPSWHQLNGAP